MTTDKNPVSTEKSSSQHYPPPNRSSIKYREKPDSGELAALIDGYEESDAVKIAGALNQAFGVKDFELTKQIFDSGVRTHSSICTGSDCLNVVIQSIHDVQPKDAVEAKFATQASALFFHGLSNLQKAETAEMACHADHYTNKAVKLLRLHNETIEALSRYRRGGEQKVTVTHAVITEKAIVNNFSEGGRGFVKNKGDSSCSQENAERKPELMDTDRADSHQWKMAGADCMAEKVPAQKRKKGVGGS